MATKTVRIGCIGVGPRGRGLMKKMLKIPGAKIIGLYDPKPDALKNALADCKELGFPKVKAYSSSEEMFADDKIDAVVIATSWAGHVPLATAAMKAGKAVGMEVGPAMCIQDCYKLVQVQEETGMPFMFLENACYGRDELLAINMIKEGLFGEIIHVTAGYQHCVTDLIYKEYKAMNSGVPGNERILNRMKRNMEPYPTHGLGPVAKGIGINRGNRILTLSAMATKARGLNAYIEKTHGKEEASNFVPLAQGDVVTTMMKCANGETIMLTWNTGLPAPATRSIKFHGTNGMYHGDLKSVHIDGMTKPDPARPSTKIFESQENYLKKYTHPGWKWFDKNKLCEKYGINTAGHGDMDLLTLVSFVECLKNGYDMPIDVYDAATWMAVSVLVEESLALGGQPVFMPDFTGGKWLRRGELNIDKRWDCGV